MADDVIGNPKVVVGIDGGQIQKDATKIAASIGAALTQAERAAARSQKAIQGQIDKLNAVGPTKSISTLSKAIEQMGGTSTLSSNQLARLTSQVNALAAAGAKVPKNLASLTLPVIKPGAGLGAALSAAQADVFKSFNSGGPLGAGLAALGPAGLAAAAGIGAVTVAATAAFVAIKGLAGQAEQFGNIASSTGLGVVQVQQLGALFEDAGFQAGELEKIMLGLAKAIEGDGDALAKFGIDVREFKGLAPEEQLVALAKAVTSIIDPTARAAAEMAAFGKSGAKVDAALRAIGEGSFKTFGAMSEAQIAELQRVDAELDAAARAWTNWKNQAEFAMLRVAQIVGKEIKNMFMGGPTEALPPPPPLLTVEGALAAGRAAIDSENARKRKAASLEQRKLDEEEAKRRAKAEPEAFASGLASASEALDAVKVKIAATFDPADLSSKLDAIDEEAAASISKIGNEIEKVNRSKDLFAPDKAKIISVYEAEIAKVKELAAAKKAVALDDATHKQLEQDRKDELTMLEAAKQARKGVQDLMNAAQEFSGVNPIQDLTDAIHDLGPGASAADVEMAQLVKDVAVLGGVGNLTAAQMEVLRAKIEALQGRGAKLPESFKKVRDTTKEWVRDLDEAASILKSMGENTFSGMIAGFAKSLDLAKQIKQQIKDSGGWSGMSGAGKVGVGLGAAQGVADIGIDAYKGADVHLKTSVAKGVISGAARGAAIGSIIPVYGTIIGAAIGGIIGGISAFMGSKAAQKKVWTGLQDLLVQQFGSLDKAKEAAARYGVALDKALDSKNAGKLTQAIKDIQTALNKAQQDSQNQKILAEGVGIAQQGAQTLLGLMDKLSPKAQAAGNALVKAVGDAMVANGLGFLPTGKLAESDSFGAVQGAVGAAGQITQGLRQAGGIDTNFLANGGAFADALREQAVAAAKEAGLSDAEAQKAGLAAVAPLLKDQLNASLESGQKLSAQTQQLIDEAKANGITIVADPLIASLDTQNKMLAELRKISGSGDTSPATGGGSNVIGSPVDFTRGRLHAASGLHGFTGSGSPLIQTHPGEYVAVLPGVASMGQLAARAGGSASLLGGSVSGGVSAPSVSMPVQIHINGANQSPQQIADAVVYALDGRTHRLNAVLAKRGLR
jgi:hypothetical protein